jgi:hypothetical protein
LSLARQRFIFTAEMAGLPQRPPHRIQELLALGLGRCQGGSQQLLIALSNRWPVVSHCAEPQIFQSAVRRSTGHARRGAS